MKRKMRNNTLVSAIIAIGVIFFTAVSCDRKQQQEVPTHENYRHISATEAREIMSENPGVIILDVRTIEEHNEFRIEGSTSLPVAEISERAEGVLPDKDAKILVHCLRGMRSKNAANTLLFMGYTNVIDFGGLETWTYEVMRD